MVVALVTLDALLQTALAHRNRRGHNLDQSRQGTSSGELIGPYQFGHLIV